MCLGLSAITRIYSPSIGCHLPRASDNFSTSSPAGRGYGRLTLGYCTMRLLARSMGREAEGRRYIPWLFVYVYCLLAFCTEIVDCIILPPIHWNASNPMFKTSNNDHVIQVNMYDELDFVCPTFEEWEDSSQFEYYIIYQVSKKEYDDCYIYPETKAIMIVNCSSPNQRKRFTILFEPFASIPHVPEFKKGGTYYYISTSTGQRDGIANVQQGACLYRNMKLTITVCCASTTTTTSTAATTTTTTKITTVGVKPSHRPSTSRPVHSTTGHSTKFTDHGRDKTSFKPTDKEKGPKDENSINKDTENELINPKKQGLVNQSRTVTPSRALLVVLCLLSLLSWLRR